MEGAAAGVAWSVDTGQRAWRSEEEDQEEGKTQTERKGVVPLAGRSPGRGEAGRTRRQAG